MKLNQLRISAAFLSRGGHRKLFGSPRSPARGTMLSEFAGAMRDVFDLLGCLGKRLVLIGITLKPGLGLYQQRCEVKDQFYSLHLTAL